MTDRDLFIAALNQDDPAKRQAYLQDACGSDSALRQRIEALLKVYDNAGSFLEAPPASATLSVDSAPSTEVTGTVIGPYKLLQPIGEGGMGTVYMAEQTQPVRRTVALKLIKTGMDSRQVLARFGAERQALALMDHPNIAKVFDAGTTDTGRPYFVMELVKGIPITKFCDERRLTTRERLELAIPVCQAVQHAHQKGIIHRDLKPSNVLIALYDGKPVPKVIDFGVAKATGQRLTDQTLYTEFGSVVGTLEYMSPEQAELNQLDIDTRSDIYSLGVLLYELLTGSTPLERKRLKEAAFLEVLRVIREEESPRPSIRLSTTEELPSIAACRNIEPRKLSGLVRGELDWIVMKALEKDRNRRYETANGLAADLRRYLDDEPVLACPPSGWYRFGKLARRHKVALTIAAVLLMAAAVAAGSLGWTVRDRAARRTILEQQAVLALDDAQAHLDRGAWREALSSVRRAQGILTGGGSPRLMQRIAQRRADLELVARLEEIRLERAAIKGSAYDSEGAALAYAAAFREFGLPVTDLAVDEAARRVESSPIRPFLLAALDGWAGPNPEHRAKLLTVALRADDDPWRRQCRDALLRDDRPALLRLARQPESLAQSPATLQFLGGRLYSFDRPAAVKLLSQAQQRHPADMWINLDLAEVLMNMTPPQVENAIGYYRAAMAIRPESAGIHLNLANALKEKGDLDAAIAEYREAIRLKPDLVVAHGNLGLALEAQGKLEEAVGEHRAAIRLNPDLADTHTYLGLALEAQGKLEEAVGEYRAAIRLKPDLADAHTYLGSALQKKGQFDAAIAEFRETIRLTPDLGYAHSNLGGALAEKGELDEAIAECRAAIRLEPDNSYAHVNLGNALTGKVEHNAAMAEFRKAIRLKPDFAIAHSNLGNALSAKGELDAAIDEYREAIRLKPDFANAHAKLGVALAAQGKLEEAVGEYRAAIRLRPDVAEAHNNLGVALVGKGQLDEAIAEYREAIRLKPDDPLAHYNLGNALEDKGQLDAAIAECREAIRLKPDLANAHASLGVALRNKGQFDAAIAECREAIRLKPDLAEAHCTLGGALTDTGKHDAAIAECREAIRLRPDYAEAHGNLGAALSNSGKHDAAIAEYREAIRLKPDLAISYNNLAWAMATRPDSKFRDPGRAVELAKKAIELAPNGGVFWNTLGVAEYRAGDWKAAIDALTKSLEVRKGGDSFDWFFLAMAHWQLGEKPHARSWYDKAVRWMEKNQPKNEELVRFRTEAAAFLEVNETKH